LRVCAWWFLFKNYSVKDWVAFCEVYGMPLRLGKYDPGATKADREALMTAISMLGSDAAGIISKSTEIDFIRLEGASINADLYERLATFANKEMSKAILGQTLTAEVGEVGSYAASQTHNDVRLDLAKADTKACAATMRYQLIRPLVGFNYGWDTSIPDYEPVWKEEEDLKDKSDWVTALLDRNVEMPASFIRLQFNIPEPKKGEAVVGAFSDRSDRQAAKFARIAAKAALGAEEEGPGDTLAALGDKTLSEAATDDLMAPVAQLLDRVGSLEEFRDGLMDLYGDMDSTALGDLMARALALAELAGRFDVKER